MKRKLPNKWCLSKIQLKQLILICLFTIVGRSEIFANSIHPTPSLNLFQENIKGLVKDNDGNPILGRKEMAFENTRWDDLMRWKAGHLIDVPVEDIKFVQSQFPAVAVNRDIT